LENEPILSGAAQAARCVANAAQCHRNVEPISNYDENRWLAGLFIGTNYRTSASPMRKTYSKHLAMRLIERQRIIFQTVQAEDLPNKPKNIG
jgi:hypothetical protein